MNVRRPLSLLAGALLMVLATSAGAADLVVVASDAPGFEPGQIVAADAALDIPAGTSVTLISETGKAKTLSGPYRGPSGLDDAGGGKPGLVSSLSGMLKGTGRESASLGVMRAVGTRTPPDDPWVIDVNQKGHHCARAGGPVALWRAKGKKARALTLKNLSDRSRATADWPAGAERLDWPPEVELRDGARYMVGFKGSRSEKRFTLHLVPSDLPSDAHRAVWMANNGCQRQATRLLGELR